MSVFYFAHSLPVQMIQIPWETNQSVIYPAISITAVRTAQQRIVCGVVLNKDVWRPTRMWRHFSMVSVRSGLKLLLNVLVSV